MCHWHLSNKVIHVCNSSSNNHTIRLDFEAFVLSNPVTVTTITVGPAPATVVAGSGNSIGQCQADTFSVTNPGGRGMKVLKTNF